MMDLQGGSLFVATDGKPYPVKLLKTGGKERGTVTFSEWDKGLSLTAPSPSVDISDLKG